MKDLLATIIKSIFKYVVNPSVWSRVAADMNTSTLSSPVTDTNQEIQSPSRMDLRDLNLSKALDLASQLILDRKILKISSENKPSGIEILAVDATSDKNTSDIMQITTDSSTYTTELSTDSTSSSEKSFEEFASDEMIQMNVFQNVSVVSVNDTQSIGTSEHSTTISTDGIGSSKLSDESNSTSTTFDSTNSSSNDSVEVLSISSDTTAS